MSIFINIIVIDDNHESLHMKAAAGGPLSLVQDGDRVIIDVDRGSIDYVVAEENKAVEEEQRGRKETKLYPKVQSEVIGVLRKYRRLVGSAHYGATTNC